MAGTKGKSGLKQGTTNNPAGRPVGSKNKIPNQIKKVLEDIFLNNIEQLEEDIKNIDRPEVRAKLLIETGKLFVPRALNEEETQSNQLRNEMIKRMMGEPPEQA